MTNYYGYDQTYYFNIMDTNGDGYVSYAEYYDYWY